MAMMEEDDDDLYAPADTIPGLQKQTDTLGDAGMDFGQREEEMEEEEEEEEDDVSSQLSFKGMR